MKNFLKKFILSLMLINLGLTINMAVTNAAPAAPKPAPTQNGGVTAPIDYLESIGSQTPLPDYNATGIHPDAAAETKDGVATVTSPILYAIDLFRYLISTIAFVYVMISAVKLNSSSNEEDAKKEKDGLVMGIVGFLLIQLADIAVKKVFFGEQGEAFQDIATAKLYATEGVAQIRGVIGFFEYFFGAIAVLVLIIRGFTLVTSAGNEEDLGKAKKHVLYAIAGLIVVGLSEVVVRGFIFPENGKVLPNVNVGKQLLVSISNFLVGFVAIGAFIMLFYGGYSYVVSGGNEEVKEKVKKIIMGAVIALLLSMGAFAIVNTMVKFETPPDSGVQVDNQAPPPQPIP